MTNPPWKIVTADYVGKRINDWTVLGLARTDDRNQQIWDVQCVCGTKAQVRASHVTRGLSRRCRDCGRKAQSRSKWRGGRHVSSSMLSAYRLSARRRGIPFELTFGDVDAQWERQNGLCYYSGLPITLPRGERDPEFTASIDRTDSVLGYVPENITWVHKSINIMKMGLPASEFVRLCRLVAVQRGQVAAP